MKKRRKRITFGSVIRVLLYALIAAGLGFAAMMFYFRLPDENVMTEYLKAIENQDYETAYSCLYVEEENPLISAESFRLYASGFYRTGTYEFHRTEKKDGMTEFKVLSEGKSDRQVLVMKAVRTENSGWKIDCTDMLSNAELYIPAGYGLSVNGTEIYPASEEGRSAELQAFAAEYPFTFTSELYASIEKTVDLRKGSAACAVNREDIVLSDSEGNYLQEFAERLALIYTQDVLNEISVYTVLYPDTYPVYDEEVHALIGEYLGEDFTAAIPWEIELEEGCRSVFYTPFPETFAVVNPEGSFALHKTLVRKEEVTSEITDSSCPVEETQRMFTYTVNLPADYYEDYYDAGSGEVKNSRMSSQNYTVKVTFSRHDGRWWVKSVSKPSRIS